jgi:hypothetical protein
MLQSLDPLIESLCSGYRLSPFRLEETLGASESIMLSVLFDEPTFRLSQAIGLQAPSSDPRTPQMAAYSHKCASFMTVGDF